MNPIDMNEDQLRKLAKSLSARKNRSPEDQCLLAKVRTEISTRILGLEVSSGYEDILAQWTWRMHKKGEIITNFTRPDGKRGTLYLSQAIWARAKGLKLEEVVGNVKVNRTEDIQHPQDFRTCVLTDNQSNWSNKVSKVERTDIPKEYWGLRYGKSKGGYQGGQPWSFSLNLSRAHKKHYHSLKSYPCAHTANAAMQAVKARLNDIFAKDPDLTFLPFEELKAAEITVYNDLIKLGKEQRVPMYIKQLAYLPRVPDAVIEALKDSYAQKQDKEALKWDKMFSDKDLADMQAEAEAMIKAIEAKNGPFKKFVFNPQPFDDGQGFVIDDDTQNDELI